MDEDGEKRVRAKRSGEEVDRISNLPDSLLFQVLLNLPTKTVVKTSVLSHRWRNFWRYVPGLDLAYEDFSEHDLFVSFVDSFLGFNSDSCLHSFKLKYDCYGDDEPEIGLLRRWVSTVVKRKVEHLHVFDESPESWEPHMPPALHTCVSLVSLKLCCVTLPSSKFVSLPSLKVMDLDLVRFADDLAFETLISRCPVLESLVIERSLSDYTQVLRVLSQSLLSFIQVADNTKGTVEDLVVEIDAPRLEYLRLSDHRTATFVLNNLASLVKVDIDIVFNFSYANQFDPDDLPKRNMIRNFLHGIFSVKDMIIASSTLKVIYDYSRCEPLPLFRNLSAMRVDFYGYSWEMLPIFLESCPNLKSLVVGYTQNREEEGDTIFFGPWCILSSLEYVEIERPLKGEAKEMKLVSYLLENSKILKKLTLCFDDSMKKKESVIFKELLTIPRLSSSCQVVVL